MNNSEQFDSFATEKPEDAPLTPEQYAEIIASAQEFKAGIFEEMGKDKTEKPEDAPLTPEQYAEIIASAQEFKKGLNEEAS